MLTLAGPARADTFTLGHTGGTGTCAPNTTVLQDQSAPGGASYEAPIGGRITQWSHQAGPGSPQQVKLKIFRRTSSPSRFFTVAQSAVKTMTPNTLNTFEVSPAIQVQADDLIGLYVLGTASPLTCLDETGASADRNWRLAAETPVGSAQTFTADAGARVNLSATLVSSGPEGPPELAVGAEPKQRSTKKVVINVACVDEACAVEATGTVKSPKRRLPRALAAAKKARLRPASAQLAVGQGATLTLRLSKRARKRVKRSGKGRARVIVTATDGDGESAEAVRIVKLKK